MEELRDIGDRVNDWIKESHPVRALEMSRMDAERLGAMALFGEKYGDWVRVVEVEDVSRELCGGTHVANTAAIGIFAIASEGSSAANVRRIEALTGPAAIDWFRSRSKGAQRDRQGAGSEQDPLCGARRAAERLQELEQQTKTAGSADLSKKAEELAATGQRIGGITVFVGRGTTATSARCSIWPIASSRGPARRRWCWEGPPTEGGPGGELQQRGRRARAVRRRGDPRGRPGRRRRRGRARERRAGGRPGRLEAGRGAVEGAHCHRGPTEGLIQSASGEFAANQD